MNLQSEHLRDDESARALNALKKVIDPELFVNIIDLGLVYAIDFSEPGKIAVSMTLSTPHCPLGEAITNGVKNALEDEFPERKTVVTLVWQPVWNFEMMTESGKKELGI